MARKKTLKDFSKDDLVEDLAYRLAQEHYRLGMTMSEMERCVDEHFGAGIYAERALAALLSRRPLEKPTSRLCPKCGKRTKVKAKDRERTLRSLCGPVTLTRNYHYCEKCKLGFYPLDRDLDLPEEGELTREMEKRVLDFAVSDVYGQAVERWQVHYRTPISENLLRRVTKRVGTQCEKADQGHLQNALKPVEEAAEVLVVQMDGSMLPIRGEEPWKEAKVGVVYRHDTAQHRPLPGSARYTAVVGTVANFATVLEEALVVEKIDEAGHVIWLGDGAIHNWRLADYLAADAMQILDWYHAVEHAMDCGKVLLGEENSLLPLWQTRAESLLSEGDIEVFIRELMDCIEEVEPRRRDKRFALKAINDLVRYYRSNAHRMNYRLYRQLGFPVGSGAVESAHRHVLQKRMKQAGQRWDIRNARRMARLRAAYRTSGPATFHEAIQRADRETREGLPRLPGRRNGFGFARYGERDRKRAAASSN